MFTLLTQKFLSIFSSLSRKKRLDEEKIKKNDQAAMHKASEKPELSLTDFAQQMEMINRLGPLSSLMKYMPGIGEVNPTAQDLERGQNEMKYFRSIINSMTPKERNQPAILTNFRKERIAKGAGSRGARLTCSWLDLSICSNMLN